MLAHAASAQGISAVENMCSRPHVLNHNSVPAACFTHPEVGYQQLNPGCFLGSCYALLNSNAIAMWSDTLKASMFSFL